MPSVPLKRSTPVDFSYVNGDGQLVSFTAPACSVGGYREALRLEAENVPDRLLLQALALCGEGCRRHLESMDVEMLQEVIQAQVAMHAGLAPAAAVTVMRAVKKKALLALLLPSSPAATS